MKKRIKTLALAAVDNTGYLDGIEMSVAVEEGG